MADSPLPPSRFGAGYTVGAAPPSQPPVPGSAVSASSAPPQVSDGGAVGVAVAEFNSLAAAAFLLVLLLGPFVAPVTMPLGLLARRQISQTPQSGGGLATATVAISCAYLAVGVVLVALALVTGNGPARA
jgi:hypothetical protein